MGSDVAEAQIDDLTDAEIDVLLEIYEVLRLTPDNGRKLGPTGGALRKFVEALVRKADGHLGGIPGRFQSADG